MGKKIKFWFLMMIGLMVVFGTQLIGSNVYAAEGGEDACASVQYSRDRDNYSKATICQGADGSLYNPYQNDYASQHIPYFEIENGNVRKICFVLPNGRGPGGNSRGCKDFPEGKILENNNVLLAAIDSTDGCRNNGVTFTCTSQNNSGNVAWYIKHQSEQVKKPIEINSEEGTGDERGTCASVYYKNSRNEDQGRSIATVCQRSDGSVYVLSPNNDGPHFVVDDEKKKLCFVIPGYQNYSEDREGCTYYTTVKEITDNSLLIRAVKNNDSCGVNGDTAECNFKDKFGSGLWYVDLTEEAVKKPGESIIESDERLDCMSSGAAGSLGWIICPILDLVSDAATGIYEKYVEPSLVLRADLFTKDGEEGLEKAWEVFRNLANLVFVVILLVVIFSQLTGVGIDNFGIKKLLPKLIVMAILVNLSFLLCEITVDLSNIVGNGVKTLLDEFSLNFKPQEAAFDGGGAIMSAIAVLAGFFSVSSFVLNPAILLTLFVSAIGVLISMLFLFVLLSGRQAVVATLTVLSPLALVMYILPNTKTYYDRWIKLWQLMLLLYPIAGLLIGGGDYVSRLMLSLGGGTFEAFTAMAIGVIPIYFIPMFVEEAFQGLGKIGSRISGWGNQASRRATSGIRSMEGYKSAQTRGLERKTRMRAGLRSDGTVTRGGAIKATIAGTRLGKAIGYQKLQAARVSAANKAREQDIAQASELGDLRLKYDNANNPTKTTEDKLIERLNTAAVRGDSNEIFSIIEQMKKSNMQASHIARATRIALGNNLNMTGGNRKNFLEEYAKKYGGDFLRKDFEQADWARKGGISNEQAVNLGVGGQWAAHNMEIDDMKDEDVAALSSERLYDLIAARRITQAQAQRVWAANGNMDDTNRLMLGAFSNKGLVFDKKSAQDALKGNYGATGLNKKMVDAYTEKAAGNVVIEDVRLRDAQGESQQTNPLGVTQNGGGSTGSGGGSPELIEKGIYNNISGKSMMQLRKMSDGTLRDEDGNVYDQGRWIKDDSKTDKWRKTGKW